MRKSFERKDVENKIMDKSDEKMRRKWKWCAQITRPLAFIQEIIIV